MKTFLFYDIETSGLNPAFDQVLTFAYIRTDLELNEIDRQTITIRLRRDIVPSPRAFLTHGLTYEELELGICEYEAARKIHKILNLAGTISLGYNSLGFDDEFLRFLFYRNLLDPYVHQYGNGCSRMDILPITVIFRVFHPGNLKWPQINGKPSLKLDLMTIENDFKTSGKAHEAMNDVEAVLGLAKKIFQEKRIWDYCLEFFNKTRDEIRINNIEKKFNIPEGSFRVCLLVSSSFGSKKNYLAPVLQIGQSMPYKNQSLWLRLDSEDILGLDAGVDVKDTFVTRKRAGDGLIVLPALERFWSEMPRASQQAASDSMEKIRRNQNKFIKFIEHHCAYKYPLIPGMDVDAALYQEGFFTAQEKKESVIFHKAPDLEKQGILSLIKSQRVQILAKRIIARNYKDKPGLSKDGSYLDMDRLRSSSKQGHIVGYKNDVKFNCKKGMQEIEEIEQESLDLTRDKRIMLDWLKDYIEKL